MARTKKETLKKILYIQNDRVKSNIKNEILEYSGYTCNCKNFKYENFYTSKRDILNYTVDLNASIAIAEGISAYILMFLSNDNVPDDHFIISRLFINPTLKPSDDFLEIGLSKEESFTYENSESYVSKQKYLDTKHSFAIFSKDCQYAMKYAKDFTKNTGIKSIIVDSLDNKFINLKEYIDTLTAGKEIIIK